MIKRVFDVSLASGLFVALLPLLLLITLIIMLRRDGGVLFIQPGLGVNQEPFAVIKFRTMTAGQINRLGKILRPLGLDELPQLINIFKGDMSFVGPRPLTQADVSRLRWDTVDKTLRWSVRPGLVGLAQFSPVCDQAMSWRLDRRYVESRSVWLDMKILVWAIFVPLVGKQRVAKWLALSA